MILRRLAAGAASPAEIAYHLWSRLHPDSLFARYDALARQAGFRKLYFVLSFDCDTEEDIDAAWDVHSRLLDLGVMPVYAVPGAMLRQGEAVYRRIAETGAEFMNHGGRSHTYFDSARNRYASCFFYDQQPRQTLREDIALGHKILNEVLGVTATGFRTPHFGTFQKSEHLAFLHGVLQEMNYAYSSSTVPFYGFRDGPVFTRFGLPEIPVSGMGTRPLTILDSWGCFRAPDRRLGPEDYRREGVGLAERLAALGEGLLNFYADPCHVKGSNLFFDVVRRWRDVATATNYSALVLERRLA